MNNSDSRDSAQAEESTASSARRRPLQGRRRWGCLTLVLVGLIANALLGGSTERGWTPSRLLAREAHLIAFGRQLSGELSIPWARYELIDVFRGAEQVGDRVRVIGSGRIAYPGRSFLGGLHPHGDGRLVLLFLRSTWKGWTYEPVGPGAIRELGRLHQASYPWASVQDIRQAYVPFLTALGRLGSSETTARETAEANWLLEGLQAPLAAHEALRDLHRNWSPRRAEFCYCGTGRDDGDPLTLLGDRAVPALVALLGNRQATQPVREHAALMLVGSDDPRIDTLLAEELANRSRCADRGMVPVDEILDLGRQLFPADVVYPEQLAMDSEALLWVAATRAESVRAQQLAEEMASLRITDDRRLSLFDTCMAELGLAQAPSTETNAPVDPAPSVSEPARR